MSDNMVVNKAQRVLLSCKTEEQVKFALRYARLAAQSQRKQVDFIGKVLIPLEGTLAVARYRLGLLDGTILKIMGNKDE